MPSGRCRAGCVAASEAAIRSWAMAKPWKRYTDEIYGGLRYLATWPPSGRVEVGDVAVFEDRSAEKQTTMEELGIEKETSAGADVRERGWASARAFELKPRAGAAAPLEPGLVAGAGVELEFKAKHAILMRAERSREHRLERLATVKQELLRMYDGGEWKREWLLITNVIHARRLIVLISGRRGDKALLTLSAGVGDDAIGLATGRGELTVVSADEMAYKEDGIENATPLYRAVRVQRRPGPNRVKRIAKRGRARGGEADFEVAEVTF